MVTCLVNTLCCSNCNSQDRSMAFEQYFAQEWRPISGPAIDSGNCNGCFDCNICLDFAIEPVVTLCGHLYCWPCIYKWLHVQSASLASDEHPLCPVCKAEISHTAMVPLYGRGQSSKESDLQDKALQLGTIVPPRPAACGIKALAPATPSTGQQLPYRNPYQNPYYSANSFEEDSPSPFLSVGSVGLHHSMVGMFGEMFYARVFGNSDSINGYPNSYRYMGGSSPRLRRQEMQANKSLSRVTFFLFCCFLLCLIVF
ncbi:E3 ubiquitin-protein ligase RMA1H1-like isoform X1 [Rhodamnia argentea]|uniref:E3 ubiquitin-protein ligase RMA n=2 Tax=Rhodamnia argentea TaxID=178133 RepID=A0ABM3HXZ6_9MYRT|nr:E3 ubiquitin-protein ligase RMA1H1-like isoform X1 [Rhodamnia argentea]